MGQENSKRAHPATTSAHVAPLYRSLKFYVAKTKEKVRQGASQRCPAPGEAHSSASGTSPTASGFGRLDRCRTRLVKVFG